MLLTNHSEIDFIIASWRILEIDTTPIDTLVCKCHAVQGESCWFWDRLEVSSTSEYIFIRPVARFRKRPSSHIKTETIQTFIVKYSQSEI